MYTETNQLLREFLGIEEGTVNSVDANIELIDFHNSWDLLMKVVDKIEDINIDGNFFNVTIGDGNFCVIQDLHGELVEINVDASSKILTVYKSCVEFVRWCEKNRLEEAKEYQLILLEGMQSNGYNVVLCCKCGETNIIEHISLPEEEIDFTCIGCGETVAPEDCMDFLS